MNVGKEQSELARQLQATRAQTLAATVRITWALATVRAMGLLDEAAHESL